MAKRDTTETRVTSESGASKGSKLARFDLIPSEPLRQLAVHYGRGAQKYEQVNGVDNWRNGYPFSLSIAALHRHLNAFTAGEDMDEEMQGYHLTAVAWHCFTLIQFMETPGFRERFDDRQDQIDVSLPVPADGGRLARVKGRTSTSATPAGGEHGQPDLPVDEVALKRAAKLARAGQIDPDFDPNYDPDLGPDCGA